MATTSYLTPEAVSAMIVEADVQLNMRSRNRRKNMYCLADGTIVSGRPPIELAGSFEGKAGTLKRSRKGRAVRQPNGRRFYRTAIPFEQEIKYYRVSP